MKDRSALGSPLGVDGPWLAAILGALDDLHDLLSARLPTPTGGGPQPVKEPAPDAAPPAAVPGVEPAPDKPLSEDDEGPVKVAEPAPDPPPRAGRGSSLDAWRAFANTAGVDWDDDMSRDDIVAACELAGVIDDTRRT